MTKLTPVDSDNSISIEADTTDDGFTSPVFRAGLPALLRNSGMSEAQWAELIQQANVGVKYNWLPICCNPCCMCCFFCNCHNKRIKTPMNKLCDSWNSKESSLLPKGFKVRYEFSTTREIVPVHNGSGATLEPHHCLVFYSCPESEELIR